MSLSSFIAALETAAPYYDNRDGYHIGAEHDQFYLYATDRPMSDEDVEKMRSLGWFQPGIADDEPYDPAESWSTFT